MVTEKHGKKIHRFSRRKFSFMIKIWLVRMLEKCVAINSIECRNKCGEVPTSNRFFGKQLPISKITFADRTNTFDPYSLNDLSFRGCQVTWCGHKFRNVAPHP